MIGRADFAEGAEIHKLEKHVQKEDRRASAVLKGCAILGCNIAVERLRSTKSNVECEEGKLTEILRLGYGAQECRAELTPVDFSGDAAPGAWVHPGYLPKLA